MQKPLCDLLHDLEQKMLRIGYSKRSMRFYRSKWNKLLKFAQERNDIYYSETLGMDFFEKHYHILEKDLNNLSPTDIQKLRAIRLVGDFQLHQTIVHAYHKHKEILTNSYFIAIRNRFKSYCISKDYSKDAINKYINQSSRFMAYFVSQDVTDCRSVDISLVHNYIKTLVGYTYETVKQYICSIRFFIRFLAEIQEIEIDFSEKIPIVQSRKQVHIPSVWTKEELKKLIDVIDRGNPKGKRDYAIILLACCLGMRCVDIKNLKPENFHWEEKKLVFTQSKTKTPVSLPLTQEVGWAVIDYLKYGRPKIDNPYVFIRHTVPFGAFVRSGALTNLVKRYMKLAHIPALKIRRGIHSLRHTLASMLLEKDTPLSTISNILGHIDTDSTAVYLKIDIQKLKECSLSFDGGINHD